MKFSNYFIPTSKEVPKEAEVISHQLMLRAGMIKKIAAGIYVLMPLGLKIMRKFENIVREEMNRIHGLEVTMPSVVPADLWKQSERWDKYGKELLRIQDRHENEFCYGPTHEEVVTEVAKTYLNSYKQTPLNLYQIQTKFRDEIRPRFGLMRGREFVMKDAYSFHTSEACLDKTYQAFEGAYKRIFERCGLQSRQVHADSGAIGGSESAEFMVMAETGEDAIMASSASEYASNQEFAPTVPVDESQVTACTAALAKVSTPDAKTIEQVCGFLKCGPETAIKTLLFKADEDIVMVLVRGDHELNEAKLAQLTQASVNRKASDKEILEVTGSPPGFLGPLNLKESCRLLIDHSLSKQAGYTVGANEKDAHLLNFVIDRDLAGVEFEVVDIRAAQAGDLCPVDGGTYELKRGIEVGHIFKLGDVYSQKMGATVLNENGKAIPLTMGCYGIGIGRTVAAAIEQNHDEKGIVWPLALAPFQVGVLVLGKEDEIKKQALKFYETCVQDALDVIIDDRGISPGIKFKDAELIGFPLQVIYGKSFLNEGNVEIVNRKTMAKTTVSEAECLSTVKEMLKDYGS